MHPFFKMNTAIRVRFEDVDAFQVVHNAKYFYFFERGRFEYLRHLGFVEGGAGSFKNYEVVIVEHGCIYKKPAVFDDILHVHLRVASMKKTSFQFQYVITRGESEEILTLGYTNLVYVDRYTLKPKPITNDVKIAVEGFEGESLGKNPGIPDFVIKKN